MNVILLEKIGKLGEIGDTASVKAGYARNFLFPKGKAIPATKRTWRNLKSARLICWQLIIKRLLRRKLVLAKVDRANPDHRSECQ